MIGKVIKPESVYLRVERGCANGRLPTSVQRQHASVVPSDRPPPPSRYLRLLTTISWASLCAQPGAVVRRRAHESG
jgi:hypothetical protein